MVISEYSSIIYTLLDSAVSEVKASALTDLKEEHMLSFSTFKRSWVSTAKSKDF
jgi:hypothetical protein